MSEKPLPDSYWVVPGQFLAGAYPGDSRGQEELTRQRLAALLEAGITTFVDLTRPGESPAYIDALHQEAERHNTEVDYQPKPIQDRGLPSQGQMVSILDTIDAALSAGGKVYLHCLGGIGRTGTVVGCWLARHGLTGEAALQRLNELYRTSQQSRSFSRAPEVDAQVLFVLDWPEAARPGPAAATRPTENTGIDWHARFLQQAAWTRDLRSYIFERTGLKGARRILEPGCGTGVLLADLDTPAAVHGLDVKFKRLQEATRHAPDPAYICGDARRLPYASGTFDIVFCHYFLLWVPEPLEALREMARVTRPGGSVIAFAEPNYKERVDQPLELAPLGRRQAESLLRQGADPDLGGRLGRLFRQAGIHLVETGPIREDARRSRTAEEVRREWAVLEADLGSFVPRGELAHLKRLDQQAWQAGTRVLSVPTYFGWGRIGPMV